MNHTNIHSEDEDDRAADQAEQQAAFQQFMMTGKVIFPNTPRQHLSSSSPHPSNSSTNTRTTPTRTTPTTISLQKTHIHQAQMAIDSFQKTFVNDWLSVDDQMRQVVDSMANLRQRIWIACASRCISSFHHFNETPSLSWKYHGYRFGSSSTPHGTFMVLELDDIDLALRHDLMAHERMSSALRQGLSQLHQAQESLGRRLDDILARWNLLLANILVVASSSSTCLSSSPKQSEQDDPIFRVQASIGRQVQECLDIFRASSDDLYHGKQLLGQTLLDSGDDRLLYDYPWSENDDGAASIDNPRAVANRVASQWSSRWDHNKKKKNICALARFQEMITIWEQKVSSS